MNLYLFAFFSTLVILPSAKTDQFGWTWFWLYKARDWTNVKKRQNRCSCLYECILCFFLFCLTWSNTPDVSKREHSNKSLMIIVFFLSLIQTVIFQARSCVCVCVSVCKAYIDLSCPCIPSRYLQAIQCSYSGTVQLLWKEMQFLGLNLFIWNPSISIQVQRKTAVYPAKYKKCKTCMHHASSGYMTHEKPKLINIFSIITNCT